MDEDRQRWLDVDAAAAYLGVTERWIRERVARREVRFHRVGKFLRFLPADLDAVAVPVEPFIAGRRVAASRAQR